MSFYVFLLYNVIREGVSIMGKSIDLIPELKDEIIDAVNNNKLILFLGAGVSALTELPLWNELADDLKYECIKEGCISLKDADITFSKISDAKQKISIIFALFKEHKKENVFYDLLTKKLSCKETKAEANIIFDFCTWTKATVLTTNADKLLDEKYEDNLVYYELKDFNFSTNKPALYKIHGSVDDKLTLVFTAEQYLKRYNKPEFTEFLKSIFESDYTILFIGYGMSEFELLEFMIKPQNHDNLNNTKLFFLSPFFLMKDH